MAAMRSILKATPAFANRLGAKRPGAAMLGAAMLGTAMLEAATLTGCASTATPEPATWVGRPPARLAADRTACNRDTDDVDAGQANGYSDPRYNNGYYDGYRGNEGDEDEDE